MNVLQACDNSVFNVSGPAVRQHPGPGTERLVSMQKNPTGICQCGCGQPTPTAEKTTSRYRKGEHRRYLRGHREEMGNVEGRFWAKVAKRGPDECWEWTGCRLPHGYGQFRGSEQRAHRFSYVLAYGPISDGKVVCHRCDNPGCVNPAHLFLGSQVDNIMDMVAKGRHGTMRGSQNPNAKLTEAQAREIRDRARTLPLGNDGVIARQYGVSQNLVRLIRVGVAWRHLD